MSRAVRRRASTPGLAAVRRWFARPEPESDGVVRTRATTRVLVLGALVLAGYAVILSQAAQIMLLPDLRLEEQARGQFEAAVEVRGRRGEIRDRNDVILATTVDLRSLRADPGELDADGIARLARALAPALEQDEAELRARLEVPGRRDVELARGLTPEQANELRDRVGDQPDLRRALFTRRDRKRLYPGRSDAAALLGVVGANGLGLAGLEQALDQHLRGEVFKYVKWQDRKGRAITMEERDAAPGADVVLTIDRRIQRIADAAVTATIERTGASAVFAVVSDVKTGEILAIANAPGLNPNDQARLDLERFKNRAALDALEPGSVMKPFVAAAALDDGMITPTTELNCENGSYLVGNKLIKDEHGFGKGTLTEVIKYSSNVCSAKLALQLGPEKTLGYLSAFGFGRPTGLGLPGETRGRLHNPKRIARIELATTAYGYGATASAIQLANAMGALGNGGTVMEPRLVKEIIDAWGQRRVHNPPRVDRQAVDPRHAKAVVDLMVAVTEKGGTGTRAAVPGYRVAGKTGTAKKAIGGSYGGSERVGSFVGLIPADDPVLAIAVMVDTPTLERGFGGLVAAPAFRQIAEASLRILGVPPDPVLLAEATRAKAPATPKPASPAADKAEALAAAPLAAPELRWEGDRLVTPDLSGLSMRDALVTLQAAGLSLQVEGSGRVASQQPRPGEPVMPGQTVALRLN